MNCKDLLKDLTVSSKDAKEMLKLFPGVAAGQSHLKTFAVHRDDKSISSARHLGHGLLVTSLPISIYLQMKWVKGGT